MTDEIENTPPPTSTSSPDDRLEKAIAEVLLVLEEMTSSSSQAKEHLATMEKAADFVKRLQLFFGPMLQEGAIIDVGSIATRKYVDESIQLINGALRKDFRAALAKIEEKTKESEAGVSAYLARDFTKKGTPKISRGKKTR